MPTHAKRAQSDVARFVARQQYMLGDNKMCRKRWHILSPVIKCAVTNLPLYHYQMNHLQASLDPWK